MYLRVAYLVDMNTTVVIVIYSIIGLYLLGLFAFVLVKKHKAKKNFEKEIEEHEKDENK